MQRYISKKGKLRQPRCNQAQTFRAKTTQTILQQKNIKLLFAPVDGHREIGVVERRIQILKQRLWIMRIDQKKTHHIQLPRS